MYRKIIKDYRQVLEADEILLKTTPNDVRLLYGYAIDLSSLGTMLEQSDPLAALANYKKAIEIDLRLTEL